MFKFLIAIAAFAVTAAAHASTTYNFSFRTSYEQSVSGYVVWNGTSITGGSGTLEILPTTGSAFAYQNGAMTNFSGSSLNTFTFQVTGANAGQPAKTVTYTVNYLGIPSFGIQPFLSFTDPYTSLQAIHGLKAGSTSPNGYVVPEIDGSRLPQAVLLLGVIAAAFTQRRKLLPSGKQTTASEGMALAH